MVKSEMKPMYNGYYSKINELHCICEVCRQEFTGFQAYTFAAEHEIDCKIKNK